MINGQLGQWLEEARTHGNHIVAMIGAVRDVFPLPEIVRLIAVAVVTAVVTSQTTIARLDERIVAGLKEREILVRVRDEQIKKIEDRAQRIEDRLNIIALELAAIRSRIK